MAVSRQDAAPVLALTGAALVDTVAWRASPAGRSMQHGTTTVHHGLGHHGAAFPSGLPVVAGLTAASLLMTTATMLPTAVPLLAAVPHAKPAAGAGAVRAARGWLPGVGSGGALLARLPAPDGVRRPTSDRAG